MKKFLLIVLMCFGTLPVKAADEAAVKKAFTQDCIQGFMQDPSANKAMAEKICRCFADKVFKKYSASQITAMNKNMSPKVAEAFLKDTEAFTGQCLAEVR